MDLIDHGGRLVTQYEADNNILIDNISTNKEMISSVKSTLFNSPKSLKVCRMLAFNIFSRVRNLDWFKDYSVEITSKEGIESKSPFVSGHTVCFTLDRTLTESEIASVINYVNFLVNKIVFDYNVWAKVYIPAEKDKKECYVSVISTDLSQ